MSINANAGDRIKISPTTSGVSALPPTVSLFYQITESLTNVDPGPSESVSPGTGWSGNTPETGTGEKAIAHWTTPPLQVIEDSMNVGVAAFHMNEIEKVEIAADGGDWVEITDPTLNSDSGVYEYHTSVGVSEFGNDYGPTELRARVTPNSGIQRVLSLSMVVGTRAALQNVDKPAQYTTVYVDSVNGNNSNAGTEAAPWQTLTKAVRGGSYDGTGSGDSSGRIVYLKAGEYVYEDTANSNYGVNPDAWITITPALGVSRSSVRVVKPSGASPRMDVQNIYWKGIDFVGASNSPYFDATIDGSSKSSQDPCAIFLENCTIGTSDKSVSRYIFNTNTNFLGGAYCVNVTGTAYSKPFIGLALARGCTAADVSEDTFTNTKAVINCVLEESQLPPGSSGHPDVYQIVNSGVTPGRTVTTENNIVYGLQCYNTDAPILFTSNLDLLKDCAFVNIYSETLGRVSQFRDCNLQHVLVLNYHQNLDADNVATDGNNFLIEELEFTNNSVDYYVNYNNVKVENCSFWVSNIIQGTYPAGHLDPSGNSNAGDPIDIVTDNCSNAKPGTSGFPNVEYTSRGWNNSFADTATGSKNVPCDVFNRPRNTSGLADRGAFEGDPSGYFPASSDVGSSFEPLTGTWETYATLQSELNAVADGGTLDLTGRGFAPTSLSQTGTGFALAPGKSVTVTGGFFSGAPYNLVWTNAGNGAWEAPISASVIASLEAGNSNRHLVDFEANVEVYAQQFPAYPGNWPVTEFDHSANSGYFAHDADTNVLVDNVVTGDSDKIVSFDIIDAATIAATEAYLMDSSFGKSILWKLTPNVSGSMPLASITQPGGTGTTISIVAENAFGGDYNEATSADYFSFAFHGQSPANLGSGEFCMDVANSVVRYKPVTPGRPDFASVASMVQCVDARTDEGTTSTFENCTFSNTAPAGTVGQIYSYLNAGQLVVRNSRFDHGKEAVRGNGKYYYCDFYRFSERTLGSAGPGLVVEDCSFRAGGATNSAILTQGVLAGEENRIKIQRNYFTISRSTHGQAISLYKDSWQNALVKDNIFYNCKIGLTYQNFTSGTPSTITGDGYALAVENNLFYVDDVYTPDGLVSQPSLAQVVEQMTTTHLDGLNPQVRFRHNSLMYDPSDFGYTADRWRIAGMMNASGFQDCDVFYESQITGYRTTGDSDGDSTRNFLSNMIFDTRGNGGASAFVSVEDWWMDITRSTYDVDDYLDFTTLRPKATLASQGCVAQDAGDVGARFTGLAATDLSTLKAGWADTFTPVAVPAFDENLFTTGDSSNGRATDWSYWTDYSDQAIITANCDDGTKVQILDPNP